VSALLSVRSVSFAYSGNPVLHATGFSAEAGEFLVLMGVNGAGKSTLLDIIAGLRSPGTGQVLIDGRDLRSWSAAERARAISHLPQATRNDMPFTVEQVVLMGRYAYADKWFESAEDKARAYDAMERMDCLRFRDRLFSTLSGGERQRVLLSACIAQNPRLMLFDEPSTFLDVHQQLQCFATLADLAREGALCIAVTHDLNLALAHCTRVLILNGGKLAADFAVEDAGGDRAWLGCLSPRLELSQTPHGKPWVFYR
jgi:iron complex transport system ATP-binding protein